MGRKKLNLAFPVSRIKRMMQSDEDIGKIATHTPVLVAKGLELLLKDMTLRAADLAESRGTDVITNQHYKKVVDSVPEFDFLRPQFEHVLPLEDIDVDPGQAEEGKRNNKSPNTLGKRRRTEVGDVTSPTAVKKQKPPAPRIRNVDFSSLKSSATLPSLPSPIRRSRNFDRGGPSNMARSPSPKARDIPPSKNLPPRKKPPPLNLFKGKSPSPRLPLPRRPKTPVLKSLSANASEPPSKKKAVSKGRAAIPKSSKLKSPKSTSSEGKKQSVAAKGSQKSVRPPHLTHGKRPGQPATLSLPSVSTPRKKTSVRSPNLRSVPRPASPLRIPKILKTKPLARRSKVKRPQAPTKTQPTPLPRTEAISAKSEQVVSPQQPIAHSAPIITSERPVPTAPLRREQGTAPRSKVTQYVEKPRSPIHRQTRASTDPSVPSQQSLPPPPSYQHQIPPAPSSNPIASPVSNSYPHEVVLEAGQFPSTESMRGAAASLAFQTLLQGSAVADLRRQIQDPQEGNDVYGGDVSRYPPAAPGAMPGFPPHMYVPVSHFAAPAVGQVPHSVASAATVREISAAPQITPPPNSTHAVPAPTNSSSAPQYQGTSVLAHMIVQPPVHSQVQYIPAPAQISEAQYHPHPVYMQHYQHVPPPVHPAIQPVYHTRHIYTEPPTQPVNTPEPTILPPPSEVLRGHVLPPETRAILASYERRRAAVRARNAQGIHATSSVQGQRLQSMDMERHNVAGSHQSGAAPSGSGTNHRIQ